MAVHHTMASKYLNELHGGKDDWCVEVRVVRIWESVNFRNNDALISLDMILIDGQVFLTKITIFFLAVYGITDFVISKQGTPMHAIIRRNMVDRFKPCLTEQALYEIRNFRVEPAPDNYRPVLNNNRMVFMLITAVQKIHVENLTIPRHYFHFATRELLQERVNNSLFLTGTDPYGPTHKIIFIPCLIKKTRIWF